MTWGVVPFVFLAGVGFGVIGGVLFARSDQVKVFDLMTSTVDKLTTSALFPGLKGVVEQVEAPPSEMYSTVDEDASHVPDFLKGEEDESPWDYSMAKADV